MSTSTDAIVRGLEHRIDGIEGLITLRSSEGRVVALVEDRKHSGRVRKALVAFGVPSDMLAVYAARDHVVPYPNDDVRLMAWIEQSGSAPDPEQAR